MIIHRKAVDSDAAAVSRLLNDLELMRPSLSMSGFWVAVDDGEIVGIAHIEEAGGVLFISSVGVAKDHRVQGIASRMLGDLIAASEGDLYLYTVIPEFFRRLGFCEAEQLPGLPERGLFGCDACEPGRCVCMMRPAARRRFHKREGVEWRIRMGNSLLDEIRDLLSYDRERDEILQRVCRLIYERVPRCDWVGFYLVDPLQKDELILGPFVGEPTEHVRIQFGRGVCGSAAAAKKTVVVDDVSAEANYLSCSPKVRSEIVVPVMKGEALAGELDIDSHAPAAFGDEQRLLFEEICSLVSKIC